MEQNGSDFSSRLKNLMNFQQQIGALKLSIEIRKRILIMELTPLQQCLIISMVSDCLDYLLPNAEGTQGTMTYGEIINKVENGQAI